MSAVTLPCEEGLAAAGTAGRLRLVFARAADGVTRLGDLDQRAPLRVLFPAEDRCGLPTAVIVTTSGGLVGGDRLDIALEAGPGARALVTSQAAEKVYRSLGRDVVVRVSVTVAAKGWLEWLPQETILFDGGRLDRATTIEVAAGGALLAGEILVFGRRAHGERLRRGRLYDRWRVTRQGRPAWADTLRLTGDISRPLADPACFAGAAAAAMLVVLVDDPLPVLPPVRALLDGTDAPGLRSSATIVNGLLIARWLGQDARTLRAAVTRCWRRLRADLEGLPATVPGAWTT